MARAGLYAPDPVPPAVLSSDWQVPSQNSWKSKRRCDGSPIRSTNTVSGGRSVDPDYCPARTGQRRYLHHRVQVREQFRIQRDKLEAFPLCSVFDESVASCCCRRIASDCNASTAAGQRQLANRHSAKDVRCSISGRACRITAASSQPLCAC